MQDKSKVGKKKIAGGGIKENMGNEKKRIWDKRKVGKDNGEGDGITKNMEEQKNRER